MSEFTVAAAAGTDIWKKPPTTDVFNAPYTTHSSAPLSTFRSASLTFAAPYTTQYDQAGLLLIFHPPASSSAPAARRWIKTGIEFYHAAPRLSTVCCDSYADWSVAPLPSPSVENGPVAEGRQPVTVRIARESDENGVGFWVYHVPQGAAPAAGKSAFVPLREIAWVYGLDRADEWTLEVAAAAARPNKEVEGKLEARFWDFNVEWD